MRIKKLGKNNPNYKKSRSVVTRKRISEAQKGKVISEDSKRKMSEARKGRFGGKNHPQWKGEKKFEVRFCKWCGKKFKVLKRKKKICCCLKCRHQFISGKNAPNWRGGISFEPYGLEFNNMLKRKIRNRDNHTCQECGFSKKELGYKLHIHHIDYNKRNNLPNNLISLCKSCHSKTNFNREQWTNYYESKVIK